jgi:hypothetical protein
MAVHSLLNGYEAAISDVLHADSDSDIDCCYDESEQETVTYMWKTLVQIKSAFKGF